MGGSGVQYCKNDECGDPDGDRFAGPTDRNGCDINAFRFQVEDFYGPGSNFTVDTTKKFTIVTQFHESGGKLTGVSQHYVQDGKKIEHPNYLGLGNTETDDLCAKKAEAMNDRDSFAEFGGMAAVEASLKNGVTLVLSMWDDIDVHMNWLDSVMDGDDASVLGQKRGTCDPKDGDPTTLREQYPESHVSYTNFKVRDIDDRHQLPALHLQLLHQAQLHLTVLVEALMLALICALQMSSQPAWSLASAVVQAQWFESNLALDQFFCIYF